MSVYSGTASAFQGELGGRLKGGTGSCSPPAILQTDFLNYHLNPFAMN